MDADGTWNITMKTPLGRQEGTVVLVSGGAKVTGTFESRLGSGELTEGAIEGDTLTWQIPFAFPHPFLATFSSTIDGDSITGTVDLGRPAGKAPFTGRRV